MSYNFNIHTQDIVSSTRLPKSVITEETSQICLKHQIEKLQTVKLEHTYHAHSNSNQNNLFRIQDINYDPLWVRILYYVFGFYTYHCLNESVIYSKYISNYMIVPKAYLCLFIKSIISWVIIIVTKSHGHSQRLIEALVRLLTPYNSLVI